MSYQDLASQIAAAIDTAVAALAQLAEEERTELVARVEGALGFARVSLEMTDPGLITDAAKQALVDEATSIANDAVDVAQNPAYFEDLIAAVLLLPASRGRDVEQTVKEAAASYQRGRGGCPKAKLGGTSTSSATRSWIEARPKPASVSSIPARRMSRTFFTPASPLAARPQR